MGRAVWSCRSWAGAPSLSEFYRSVKFSSVRDGDQDAIIRIARGEAPVGESILDRGTKACPLSAHRRFDASAAAVSRLKNRHAFTCARELAGSRQTRSASADDEKIRQMHGATMVISGSLGSRQL